MESTSYREWKKDQIIGFSLIPVVLILCIFHNELANLLGTALQMLIAIMG